MKRLLEFLQDNEGQLSNARLANFLVVLCFVADWVSHIARFSNFNPSFTIVGIVSAIMGIKVVQKFSEKKS